MKLRASIKREEGEQKNTVGKGRRKGVKILKNREEGARPEGSCHPCTLLKPRLGGGEVPPAEGGEKR